MNYTSLIEAVKELVMRATTTRLVLLWAISISCILAWKAADIIHAAVEAIK